SSPTSLPFPSFYMLLFDSPRAPRDLHSFPTRRSSDLRHPPGHAHRARGVGLALPRAALPRLRRLRRRGADDVPTADRGRAVGTRSEEHTSELQSRGHLVCRLLLEKKKTHHGSCHSRIRLRRCSAPRAYHCAYPPRTVGARLHPAHVCRVAVAVSAVEPDPSPYRCS